MIETRGQVKARSPLITQNHDTPIFMVAIGVADQDVEEKVTNKSTQRGNRRLAPQVDVLDVKASNDMERGAQFVANLFEAKRSIVLVIES